MSFSEDDKEALGEDLDDLKSNLEEIKIGIKSINRNLGTLVTITVSLLLLSCIGIIATVVVVINAGN
jgi:hypothetical protein